MTTAMAPAPTTERTFPYFTEEHFMLRDTVKQFCEREIAPFAEEWDEAGIFPRELLIWACLGFALIHITAAAGWIGGQQRPTWKAFPTPITAA
jgi:alkylation response protein AidB-like acyl-CoA dehydrogenase